MSTPGQFREEKGKGQFFNSQQRQLLGSHLQRFKDAALRPGRADFETIAGQVTGLFALSRDSSVLVKPHALVSCL